MSIHLRVSSTIERRLHREHLKNTAIAVCCSCLIMVLIGWILYTITMMITWQEDSAAMVSYIVPYEDETLPDDPAPEKTALEVPRPSTSFEPNHASVLTAESYADIAIARIDLPPLESEGFAQNIAEENTNSNTTDSSSEGNGFGSGHAGGSTLKGTFYDLKQTRNGTPTGITPQQAVEVMHQFVSTGWKESTLNKYYRSPAALYASHFYIPKCQATDAPKAFQCADQVKDSRWCAVYRGTVTAPATGRFRFVGAADDAVVVRFNGKNVFDYGWYQLTIGKMTASDPAYYQVMKGHAANKTIQQELAGAGVFTPPVTFYQYEGLDEWNERFHGLAAGTVFNVEKGKKYPLEILVSEIPGGEFGVILLIEDLDALVEQKDAQFGSPILHLFRTNRTLPPNEEKQPIYQIANTSVWKAK